MRKMVAVASALCLMLIAGGGAGAQQRREFGDVRVFARVGQPGQPEGIAVDSRGTVFVSTNNRGKGGEGPSKIFRYTRDGQLAGEYTAQGQNLEGLHGLLGIALDSRERLYVMDYDPARVLRVDPVTGRQDTYATFPDLPLCAEGQEPDGTCEPSNNDDVPWANWPVFDAAGNLYVTDLHQATIWKIPPGGGEAKAWHQSADYASIFSLNGMQFDRRDGSLVFVLTGSFQPGSPARGHVYRLRVRPDGSPGERTLLAQTRPAEGPDGMALGETGRIFVALVTSSQVLVLEPDGTEIARIPEHPVANAQLEIPFDAPASIAFGPTAQSTSVLVTNHSYFTANPESWAVLDVEVGERGMALHRPVIPNAPAGTGANTEAPEAGPGTGGLPASGGGAALVALLLMGTAFTLRTRGLAHRV